MPVYLFKGIDSQGYRVGGAKKFASRQQMDEYLSQKNITGYDVYESATQYKTGAYALVSPKELSIFCKQESVIISSQISQLEGVSILADQIENKQLKIALKEIYDFVAQGYTFVESMSMYDHIFADYLLNMVSVGENSGALDVTFARMSDYYDKESKMRKKLKSAIAYPAVLTTLMAAIVLLLVLKVLPMFNSILTSMGGEMPDATKLILSAGEFIAAYFWAILIGVAAIVFACLFYFRTESGRPKLDKLKLTIPALGPVNAKVEATRFARSMSILIKSGIQVLTGMEQIMSLMENMYLKDKFNLAIEEVKEGQELSKALEKIGIFPVLFLKMLSIGQKTGAMVDMLDKCANVLEDEVDETIERFTTLIEPVLIIILSFIVGIILLSVILPMISIMTAIG